MDITGKLIKTMELVNGQNSRGAWKKQEFVIETVETQYPKQACFSLWGDKCDWLASYRPGDLMKVTFDVESREFNNRWYTELRAFRVEQAGGAAPSRGGYSAAENPGMTNQNHSSTPPASTGLPASNEMPSSNSEADDLPF